MNIGWDNYQSNKDSEKKAALRPAFLKIANKEYDFRILCTPGVYFHYTTVTNGKRIHAKATKFSTALRDRYGASLKIQKKAIVCVADIAALTSESSMRDENVPKLYMIDMPYASVFQGMASWKSAMGIDPADSVKGVRWRISRSGKGTETKYVVLPMEQFPLIGMPYSPVLASELTRTFLDDPEKIEAAKRVYKASPEKFFLGMSKKAEDSIQQISVIDNSSSDERLEALLFSTGRSDDVSQSPQYQAPQQGSQQYQAPQQQPQQYQAPQQQPQQYQAPQPKVADDNNAGFSTSVPDDFDF